jgi:hypothetical protein
MEKATKYPEKRDIRAIAVLLATQGMIRLGEIPDPFSGQAAVDDVGARFFIDLLAELRRKTRGNLDAEEEAFLDDILENLRKVLDKKSQAKNG